MSALASALPQSLAVEPGAEVVVPVRIRNPSSVVDEYSVRVVGEPEAWAEVDPPTIALFPNAEAVVNVHVRPPRTPTTMPGVVPFAVIVASSADPAGTIVEEGVLTVGPFHESAAELAPRTSRGRRRGKHELAFDNFGNTPVTAVVSAADKEKALEFRFAPATLAAPPGTAAFAKAEVRARDRLLTGPERMHMFQVLVEAPGAEPLALDGVFVQRALLPRLLVPLALVVAALAVAWVFLRPDAESTAEKTTAAKREQRAQEAVRDSAAATETANEAVKTAATASSKATAASAKATAAQEAAASAGKTASAASTDAASAEQAGKQAGAAASAASESASAASEAVTSIARSAAQAAPSQGPIPGRPTAIRLSVNCPPTCEAAVAVPEGEQWLLTDLVFGNPMGDRGVVTLARDGDLLFVESLETFRDLAFQFTAPILLNKGQKLEFRADCQNAAGSPEGTPAPCTPGVYAAGFAQAVSAKNDDKNSRRR
jgi:hypothetical protein